jgi:BlaI family transcriptional regulator, penicillinase repressor
MTRPPQLAAAELAVMKLLWQNRSLTARQIMEELYPDDDRSQHGTVQRLLQRLEDKGFVKRERTPAAAAQQFSAAITRDAYLGAELESLADQLTGGSLAPVISMLIEEKKLTPAEIRRLRRIVEDK